jgi:hypothetical protein
MTDIINHMENEETGKPEIWNTFKDASELLNVSERHAWNIITREKIRTKKELNHSRKKTYVLQAEIEKYFREDEERKKKEALGPSATSEISEMSEKDPLLEMSESGKKVLSERGLALSESGKALKTLPSLLVETISENKKLSQSIAIWKLTAIYVFTFAVLSVIISILYLKDLNTRLSEGQEALSESREVLSEREMALYEMSERALSLSEREKEALQRVSDLTIQVKDLETRLLQGQGNQITGGINE